MKKIKIKIGKKEKKKKYKRNKGNKISSKVFNLFTPNFYTYQEIGLIKIVFFPTLAFKKISFFCIFLIFFKKITKSGN